MDIETSNHAIDALKYSMSVTNQINNKENGMKRVMNRLNGIGLAEENLVELRQESSEKQSINIDLVSILQKSDVVSKYNFGKDALVESIRLDGSNIYMRISKGKVIKEDTGAFIKSIKDLVTGDCVSDI